MSTSRSSFDSQLDYHRDESLRNRCLRNIKQMDSFNFFQEAGPKQRLNNLVNSLKPTFDRILQSELPNLEENFHSQTLKIKNLEDIRRNPEATEITFIDQADSEMMRSNFKRSFTSNEPAVLTDKKKSKTMSSPKVFNAHWQTVDRELREGFMRQVERTVQKVFQDSCRELMIEHPMFESALSQILDMEEETKRKVTQRREHAASKMATDRFKRQATSIGAGASRGEAANFSEAVNVHLDLKSYQQHSDRLKEIFNSYEGLMNENKSLRERINKLKAAHDKETAVMKQTQYLQADRDMKILQEHRAKRIEQRLGGIPDRSDEALDDIQQKIVPVEWFDALEGIDESLRKELNFKLARVRNQFQELLDMNTKTVDKLQNKISLMNKLSPDAYSIANLSLVECCIGISKKESDPGRIWKALNRSFGEDYFIAVVEEQYGKRFVANYNALYNEVNKVQEEADTQLASLEETIRSEIRAQKRITQDLRQEVALYRENFREQVLAIQEETRQTMEKDFESREAASYQEQFKREAELQAQIDERDEMYSAARKTIERLHIRRAFDKLKIIQLAKTTSPRVPTDQIELQLDKIIGFLKGTSYTDKDEIEKKHLERAKELELQNSDLQEQYRKLDTRNTMLENQNKLLDKQISDIGAKIASAESRQQIAYEERRKAVADLTTFKTMNKNLESIIETLNQEKNRLMLELKRYSNRKLRSNILDAELHRKEKQNAVVKRAYQAGAKVFVGVEANKGIQTDMAGLKGHLLQFTDEEYKQKFCKQFTDQLVQTIPIEQTDLQTVDSQSRQQVTQSQLESQKSNTSSRNALQIASGKHGSSQRRAAYKTGGTTGAKTYYGNALLKTSSGQTSKRRLKDDHGESARYMKSGRSGLTNHSEEKGGSSRASISQGSATGRSKTNGAANMVDVGVTCDLMISEWSPLGKRSPGRKGVNNALLQRSKKGSSKHRQSESNVSGDHDPNSFTKMNPLFNGRNEAGQDGDGNQMTTLDEKNWEETAGHSCSTDGDDLVDIMTGEKRFPDDPQLTKKRKSQSKQRKSLSQAAKNNKQAQKLAAGWRIVNERLKDIEHLEARQKSQIKYEVDKAFEMAKYLDETNFSSRDPATSQVYTSMVQMCMSHLDKLTPLMILQKLDLEKRNLQRLLTVDATAIKNNSSGVAKILNFVCLENLNNQILRIFNQVIKQTLPPSISDVQRDATEGPPESSIRIVENQSKSLGRAQSVFGSNTQKVTIGEASSLERGLTGQSIKTPRYDGLSRQQSQLSVMIPGQHSLLPVSMTSESPNIGSQYINEPALHKMHSTTGASQYRNLHLSKSGIQQRKSVESVLTVKSTNISSTKYSASMPKNLESDAQGIVNQLINDKRSLRAKIEETFKSNSQKKAAVEARLSAARRFNSLGFQSLLTSQKVGKQPNNDIDNNAVRGSHQYQEKRQHLLYREKVRNFIGHQAMHGTRSNLFKQQVKNGQPGELKSDRQHHQKRTTLKRHSESPERESTANNSARGPNEEDEFTAQYDLNTGSVDQNSGESSQQMINPEQLQLNQDGRRTAGGIRIKSQTQAVYNLDADSRSGVISRTVYKGVNRTNKNAKQPQGQKQRQTSEGFFPRMQSELAVAANDRMNGENPASVMDNRIHNSSYLDLVKTTGHQQSAYQERNAYLNHDTNSTESLSAIGIPHHQSSTQMSAGASVTDKSGGIKRTASEIVVKINTAGSGSQKSRTAMARSFTINQQQMPDGGGASTEGDEAGETELIMPTLQSRIDQAKQNLGTVGQRISRSNYFTQGELMRHSNPDLGGKNYQSLTKDKKILKRKHNKKVLTVAGKQPMPQVKF